MYNYPDAFDKAMKKMFHKCAVIQALIPANSPNILITKEYSAERAMRVNVVI
jgi:hypothetical protein